MIKTIILFTVFALGLSLFIFSNQVSASQHTNDSTSKTTQNSSCKGTAQCINGTVTKIIDGDTIRVKEIVEGGKYKDIRFSLTSMPELKTKEGIEASNFLKKICPVGSKVIVDQDDKQLYSHNRVLGKVICNGENINAKLLSSGYYAEISKKFCKNSEFSTEPWAQKYGCATKDVKSQIPKEISKSAPNNETNCEPSYPDFCIPSHLSNLDCKDVAPHKNFKVLQPDPYKFDVDKDGIGCESK